MTRDAPPDCRRPLTPVALALSRRPAARRPAARCRRAGQHACRRRSSPLARPHFRVITSDAAWSSSSRFRMCRLSAQRDGRGRLGDRGDVAREQVGVARLAPERGGHARRLRREADERLDLSPRGTTRRAPHASKQTNQPEAPPSRRAAARQDDGGRFRQERRITRVSSRVRRRRLPRGAERRSCSRATTARRAPHAP